jgi:hypothetical protein
MLLGPESAPAYERIRNEEVRIQDKVLATSQENLEREIVRGSRWVALSEPLRVNILCLFQISVERDESSQIPWSFFRGKQQEGHA